MTQLEIKVVKYTAEIADINKIRYIVFQQEQEIAAELEFDGEDEQAEHLLAYWNKEAVGTARIRHLNQQTVKIERLAVLPVARGKGIGTQLMKKALEVTQNKQEVVVYAQVYIKQLYSKLGFEQVGTTFEEAGIPHIKMLRKNW